MRFAGLVTVLLALSGCDQGPAQTGIVRTDAARHAPDADAALAPSSSAFDYRYAFRLSPARIAPVQESHARGCDQLGLQRCRITAMRYKVADDNTIEAVLTLKLDPALARAFGKAAIDVVSGAKGVLTDAEIAGADSLAATGRSDTVIARLRESLGNADAQLRTATAEQRPPLSAKADRLRAAITTIGEVEQGAGTSVATTPVIFTYTSGGAIPGLGGSSEASFDAAGQTFLQSLSGLAVILAGVGPWALLLIGGALILRRIVQGDPDTAPPQLPPAPVEPNENRNVIQRWFAREDDKEHEPA